MIQIGQLDNSDYWKMVLSCGQGDHALPARMRYVQMDKFEVEFEFEYKGAEEGQTAFTCTFFH